MLAFTKIQTDSLFKKWNFKKNLEWEVSVEKEEEEVYILEEDDRRKYTIMQILLEM